MRKLLIFMAFLFISMVAMPSFAQNAGDNNPCNHLAELVQSKTYDDFRAIADTCTPAQKASVDKIFQNISDVDTGKWNSVIKTIGETIATTAKELGVAVNDFLKSPAGILLVIFLFLKFIGGKLLIVPVFFMMAWVWYSVVNRFTKDNIKYEYVPYLWGAFRLKRMVSFTRDRDSGSYFAFTGVVFGLIWVGMAIAISN